MPSITCVRCRCRRPVKCLSALCLFLLVILIMKRFEEFAKSSHSIQRQAMELFQVHIQPEANYKELSTLEVKQQMKEDASMQDSQVKGSTKTHKENEGREADKKNKETAKQESPELKGEALDQKKETSAKETSPKQKTEAPSKKETPAQKNEASEQKNKEPLKEEAVPAKTEAIDKKETQGKEKEALTKKDTTEQKEATTKDKGAQIKQQGTNQKQEAKEKEQKASAKEETTEQMQATAKDKETQTLKEDKDQTQKAPKKGKEAKEEAREQKEATAKKNESQTKKEATDQNEATVKEKEVPAQKEAPVKKEKESLLSPPPDLNASDFEDLVGDVYAQQENPFLTKGCPSSIRNKVNNTEFGKIFLHTIPILQWAALATPEQYQRLRRYTGCFGWNYTSWDLLKKTMDLLNSSANGYIFSDWNRDSKYRSSCIRCAAVGNGGILNGSKMGHEIDQHDYVFRVNGAILTGHEEDVGNHTSFYFFSTNTMMNSLYMYRSNGFKTLPQSKETSYTFLTDHDRDYYLVKAALTGNAVEGGHDKHKQPSTYFGENYAKEQFKMLHPDFMRYLRNRFLPSGFSNNDFPSYYRPSTGASMLLTALHACDQVNAYGFLTPDYENYSDHYYDKKKHKVHFYSNHNYRQEMALWQKLHEQRLIKLYTRS